MGTEIREYRFDIQGLRAIAVLFVVLYHSGVTVLPGGYAGVDIFFVISGYLITGHLLQRMGDGGVRFANFYARRARRILPASFLVLFLSMVAAWVWIPPLELKAVFQGAIATALYVPNILFAAQGTNYLVEATPSVFQHYWSLGVEEQFYLVWPAFLVVGMWMCRRSERRLFILVAAAVAVSFAAGVIATEVSQPWAFFSLPTRAWELGVGGLVAFALRRKRIPLGDAAMGVLGWIGVAGIAAAGSLYGETTPFPSFYAALPVLATALVIFAGSGQSSYGPSRLLATRPMQYIGAISYSLYLIHWPLLVIPQAAIGYERPLPLWSTHLLAAVSVVLAGLSFRYVEEPFRRMRSLTASRPRRTLSSALSASLVVVLIAGTSLALSGSTQLSTIQAAANAPLSKRPVGTSFVPDNLNPSLRNAEADEPSTYSDGCHRDFLSTDSSGCVFGPEDNVPTVALFGDSHAAQWFPALKTMADSKTIQLDSNTKSGCQSVLVPVSRNNASYPQCETWREGVIARFQQSPPDVILVANFGHSRLTDFGSSAAETWERGVRALIRQLPESSRIVFLADTPALPATPAICLSANLDNTRACNTDRRTDLDSVIRTAETKAVSDSGGDYLDMTEYFCNDKTCPPVIGNTLVYRDSHHITVPFSQKMSGPLTAALSIVR